MKMSTKIDYLALKCRVEQNKPPTFYSRVSQSKMFSIFQQMKSMDANRYATKKTIAQGMLDIALLTANASQLKYILQVGEQHQFYKLMLILISLSIVLQILSGILSLSLSLLRDCRLHQPEFHQSANVINHVRTAFAFFTTMINLFISAFDSRLPPIQGDLLNVN
ncbi:ninjurin-2 isoform X2 [Drosophila willistoni]|uniref:ninjurin-2 isoform X2 n=1 Tax=Drosophila willistoni TaxID=7260 RepID=UPI001F0845A0|nr:ninjurin-2 isoform X2 [Drosophila willistoni]